MMHEEKRMSWLYKYAAPVSIVEGFHGILQEAEEGKIVPRTEKGKKKFSKYRARK